MHIIDYLEIIHRGNLWLFIKKKSNKEKNLGKKVFYIALSFMFVAILILSACAKSTTSSVTATTSMIGSTSTTIKATSSTSIKTSTAPPTSTISTTSAGGGPTYGGRITELNDQATQDPSSWDVDLTQTGNITSVWITPYQDWYFNGDIDKYGPRGNNQFSFQTPQYIPEQYLTGEVAQSWVFNSNPLSLAITLKPGIMWTGNAHIGMAARELTATDCAFTGMRQITAPAVASSFTWIKDCIAVDKYTFRWDFNSYNANWEFYLLFGGGSAVPFCPESAAAGGADWRNAVGTGPFILSDYVSGSSATYTRNPNYWGKTTINGTQYQLPFIDTLLFPVIADQSTELAAMRTGKVDLWTRVPYTNAATLQQQAPNMKQAPWYSCYVDILIFNRIDSSPLSNLSVRQALMMATDLNSMVKLVYGSGDVLGWPVARGNPSYTPLENQPSAVQTLFTYNPTKAQQMLIAAGYPNLTITITINSALQNEVNEATVLASQWAKVGVTLQILTMNSVALAAAKNNRTYTGLLDFQVSTANPFTPILYYQGTSMGSVYKTGEPLDVESRMVTTDIDSAKRQTDLTQFCQDALADAGMIPMANPYTVNCYWPWLKNYYGEVEAGSHNQIPMIARMWIDQKLKKSLGYQ